MTPIRRFLTHVGSFAAVSIGLSLLLSLWAFSRGLHCPDCDRQLLGDSYSFWASYFWLRTMLFFIGALCAIPSALLAQRRWPALLAIVLGFFDLFFVGIM